MSVGESRERIRARVWQAIAQSELNLQGVEKKDLDALVDMVTDAALVEVDYEIAETELKDEDASRQYYPDDDSAQDEVVLWQGRPFFSISEHYVITNERVRIIKGVLGKKRQDIELIRIQDIDQTQTLRERSFNVGDITIHSHDSSAPVVVLNNIKEPQTVHELLRRAVVDIRKLQKLTFQEEM